jgi:glutathionylspermidine synthase
VLAEWKRDRPALDYGRFDFGWNGQGEPKLFEYNCDTPTAMLECGVVQWQWKEEVFPANDQFTSLHDKLIDRWAYLARDLPGGRLWVTHHADDLHEDTLTTTYMRDLAEQAGLSTRGVLIERIGVDAEGRIVDDEDYLITAIFKLYPWEWIVAEEFGRDIVRRLDSTLWLEPIWKMLWSNKAILPLLWELEPSIYQALYDLPAVEGAYPVLGVWTVGGEAAGLGIREGSRITGDEARFVPHIIEG